MGLTYVGAVYERSRTVQAWGRWASFVPVAWSQGPGPDRYWTVLVSRTSSLDKDYKAPAGHPKQPGPRVSELPREPAGRPAQ